MENDTSDIHVILKFQNVWLMACLMDDEEILSRLWRRSHDLKILVIIMDRIMHGPMECSREKNSL